ncbi:hypothetical protein KXQ82_16445 [Mucilaginibacter sp. HMF5004]|uniref:hypothetical protein n=1 Tax=Mucilaginibacter rivuli TaxID=2857527 RepID=UPI001C602056|nr:hypothetical protein [Mucilaginibacter rivuli]MBW4891319.1 hypothetical protein [Mucilaginibacter rivuli]
MNSNYLISISESGASKKQTIHDTESKLKIGVVDLVKASFKPKKGELHYYVSAGGSDMLLAFETEGYKKHKNLLVLDMIARYCVYLGFGEAIIHSTLPGIS